MSIVELQELIHEINRRYDLTQKQIFELVEKEKKDIFIPLKTFSNRKLGILESVVKYLRENHNISNVNIARLLNRDNRTIWSTYDRSRKKEIYRFKEEKGLKVPVSIFREREEGVLEVLVKYCKAELGLSNAEISRLINRDNRTIWSVANRKR